MIPCRECAHPTAKSARACPSCGARHPYLADYRAGNLIAGMMCTAAAAASLAVGFNDASGLLFVPVGGLLALVSLSCFAAAVHGRDA